MYNLCFLQTNLNFILSCHEPLANQIILKKYKQYDIQADKK